MLTFNELQLQKIDLSDPRIVEEKSRYRDFIHQNLGEFRDSLEEITLCLEYAFDPSKGGHIYVAKDQGNLWGIVVVLNTYMSKFIPEFLLVYVAVQESCRGQGIGRSLLAMIQRDLPGSIALHVEPHNPAINLYKDLGFSNKYLEMRFSK